MMKRITKWNRFIYQHAVVVAMLYSFAIFIMVCLVSSLAWESADDFLISMILSGSFGEYSPYVLVLGYTQDELAFVMGVDQSVISKNINSGIKRIQRELRAYLEED